MKEVRKQLQKYESETFNFKNLVGFELNELELKKAKKSSSKVYIQFKDMVVEQNYIIHNYSLEYHLTLKKVEKVGNNQIYIFETEDKEFKTFSNTQLEKPNIKVEVEAED